VAALRALCLRLRAGGARGARCLLLFALRRAGFGGAAVLCPGRLCSRAARVRFFVSGVFFALRAFACWASRRALLALWRCPAAALLSGAFFCPP
jgi:hypothetical protein